METTLVVIACAVSGVLVGSFLTVVVDRVPDGRSVVRPPSACGSCGARLGPPDLVPLVSWLALHGRCRRCGPIGVAPLIIESVNAALFVAFGLRFGADVALISFCIMGAALVALVAIDLRTYRLPREITYTAIAASAPFLVVAAVLDDEPDRIWQAVLGAGIALAIMGLIRLVSRGGMGDGDVRLAPLLGVVAIAAGRAGRTTALPFGPFLAAGTVVAVFAGDAILEQVWHV